MMTNYPSENLLREPTEAFSAMTLASLGILTELATFWLTERSQISQ
ncbi:MAG: hypothetical protein ACO1N3_04090 [Gammaproteobacteria bacterium]